MDAYIDAAAAIDAMNPDELDGSAPPFFMGQVYMRRLVPFHPFHPHPHP